MALVDLLQMILNPILAWQWHTIVSRIEFYHHAKINQPPPPPSLTMLDNDSEFQRLRSLLLNKRVVGMSRYMRLNGSVVIITNTRFVLAARQTWDVFVEGRNYMLFS
jgi:hypothetical protein